jgi:two-component system cell cycle sensor histidine kinase/response regulator CckA
VVVAGDLGKQIYTLRGADSIYRQFIETMSEGAVILSADGTILYGNNRLAEMLGRPLHQVLGTDLRDYLPPAEQQALEAIPREAGTTPIHREFSLMAGDGRQVPVYLSASRLPNEGGGTLLVLTDLTEQRRHAQIVAAERLARLILDQAAEVIIVCDQKGQVTRVNQAGHSLCDCSPLLLPFAEAFPLWTSAHGLFQLAPVLVGETIRDVDVAMSRHGEKLVLILNAGPLISGDQILGCVVTLTDITERERAEVALQENEAKFRTYVEAAPQALFVVDGRGRYLDFNPAALEMIGVDGPKLRSMTIADILSEASREGALRDFGALAATGRLESEYELLRPDGRSVWVMLRGVRIGDNRFMAFCQDITKRKKAEAEREQLATAIEQAGETVMVADAQGNITYVNPAFEAVTGYARTEVLGLNPRIFKSGVHDEEFYRELWETIGSGKTWQGRLVNKRKDGTLFTEDATISPVRDKAGMITSYVSVKRDITHFLAQEAELLQAQKMEGIGRLAGGVAHDFNNILSVILSSAELALESLREGDPLREDLLDIQQSGKRAAVLTRQLLAFSRKQVLQPVPLDLNQALAEMEKMLRRIIGEDIEFARVLSPDIWLVKADPGQVEQVVMNLVVNARDAMPKGGKLTLETANVELDQVYADSNAGAGLGPNIMLAVTDTGVGMDEQTMARVFEPFFTTKEVGKGTGLGLSTVYGIVKQSGGSISVQSVLGQGTTFKVYLPRDTSLVAPIVTATPAVTRPVGTETVLVVEDEQAVRNIARRILEGAGYAVLTAASGGEALLTCERHPSEIHLVLTDVVMPQMSGKDLVDRLASIRPGVRAVFMSGYTGEVILKHGLLEAGTQFIGKPFTQAELLQKVRYVLDDAGRQG